MEWRVDIGSSQCVCVKMVMAGDREYLCVFITLVVSGVTERHKGVTRMGNVVPRPNPALPCP